MRPGHEAGELTVGLGTIVPEKEGKDDYFRKEASS